MNGLFHKQIYKTIQYDNSATIEDDVNVILLNNLSIHSDCKFKID